MSSHWIFFRYAVEVVEAVEANRLRPPDAAKRIFDLADSYVSRSRFEKALGSARAGMKEEEGLTETFFRWCAHRPDPHLVEPAKSPELAEASSV